jgi:hypothetical protein
VLKARKGKNMKRSAPRLEENIYEVSELLKAMREEAAEKVESGEVSQMVEFSEDIHEAAESIINDYYEDNYNTELYGTDYDINYYAILSHLFNENIYTLKSSQLDNISRFLNNILLSSTRLAQLDYDDIENIFNNYDSIILGYK